MRALVAAALVTIAAPAVAAPKHARPAPSPPPAPATASFVGGHVTMTIPPGWTSGAADAAEGMTRGTTNLMIFVLPGSPEALMDLAEAAEADTITYPDRGYGSLGGLHVIAAPGKSKSGKGGGRALYASATCVGTIVVAESWEDGVSDKDLADLGVAIRSLAYNPDAGTMFVASNDRTIDKLDAAARKAAEGFAGAVCLGATHRIEDLAGATIEVDGTALDRKAFADAVAKVGDLATYLRMTSGMWSAQLDPAQPNVFAVTRIPTKELGEAGTTTGALFEQIDGAWKLTKIKRAAP